MVMNKTTQVFVSFFLCAAAFPSKILSHYPSNTSYEKTSPPYFQEQSKVDRGSYSQDQYTPNMSEESSFINQSTDRTHRIQQENRQMIREDNQLIQRGFDPNETYDRSTRYFQDPYDDLIKRNQDQLMRGE